MKLEEQVCSLELAKKLKELGVRQESVFYFVNNHALKEVEGLKFFKETMSWKTNKKVESHGVVEYISAFTVAELGEMLPQNTPIEKICDGEYGCFMGLSEDGEDWYSERNFGESHEIKNFHDETAANAAARMLIYLIEQGIVNP